MILALDEISLGVTESCISTLWRIFEVRLDSFLTLMSLQTLAAWLWVMGYILRAVACTCSCRPSALHNWCHHTHSFVSGQPPHAPVVTTGTQPDAVGITREMRRQTLDYIVWQTQKECVCGCLGLLHWQNFTECVKNKYYTINMLLFQLIMCQHLVIGPSPDVARHPLAEVKVYKQYMFYMCSI